jgi:hypothetical protein
MRRTKITLDEMKNYLIDGTTYELVADATFVAKSIEIRQREGQPNWDANIGISIPAVVAAFGRAVRRLQREHDIQW